MKIKKLILDHFKRFTHLTIDLWDSPKKIIVLVWPNWCGKSSIFDAFNQFVIQQVWNKLNLSQDFVSKKAFLETDDKAYTQNDSIKVFDEQWNLIQNRDKKSFYIRSAYRFTAKFNIQNIRNVGDVLSDKKRPGASIDLDERLEENYERLISWFFEDVYDQEVTGKIWVSNNLQKINDILSRVLDIKISDLWNPTKNKWQLYFEKWLSKNFPYENLSSWEKEVIDILLDLMVKTKDYNNTIFCIDEPELHISTGIQRKLLIEIVALVPDNCQLRVATHSIWFIRALQDVDLINKIQILDFSDKNFDETIVLSPIDINRQNFKKIFQTALDDLSELIAPEYLVYCEWKIIPHWVTWGELWIDAIIYNKIFSQEFPNYHFVSSGGADEMDWHSRIALTILRKAFVWSKILSLKDMDINSSWVETTLEQRARLLEQNPNLRMLKRKELENYIFDFGILQKAYPSITLENYNLIINDIVNEDIKPKVQQLKTLCDVGSINKDNRMKELAPHITSDMEVYVELKSVLLNT